MSFAIITENDESPWDDIAGVQYHFPSKYVRILKEGTKVIYYKGRMTDNQFLEKRLTKEPHYFAVGQIGKITSTDFKNFFAEIVNYSPFNFAVHFKDASSYLEDIPENKKGNYFRDGVRPITETNYYRIVHQVVGELKKLNFTVGDSLPEESLTTTFFDGGKKMVYTTRYERDPEARSEAIRIHGLTCMSCEANFEKIYGEIGFGFIHVHHNKPLYKTQTRKQVDPRNDLDIVCPNCHAMLHRDKEKLLTVSELKKIIKNKR